MNFLKNIEIIGFKSFASKTIINFEKAIVGIVGPNGSGKSNITDAIRWVFGVNSSKFLRSNISNEIIFNGSESKEQLNYAEVKLVFNNQNNVFSLNYSEIKISRRIFRNIPESEYFINGNKCRLKDIQVLAKESGLSKSSLSIISQGNISDFAESKPVFRRLFLEDAAGISKYKQNKIEAVQKLDNCNYNLNRLKDIMFEIKRKLPNLKKESEKVSVFKLKSSRLEQIEINILVKDIDFYQNKLNSFQEISNSLKDKFDILQKLKVDKEIWLENSENKFITISSELDQLNKKYNHLISEISNLKIKQITFEKNFENNYSQDKAQIVLLEFSKHKNDLEIENSRYLNLVQKNNDLNNELIILKNDLEKNFIKKQIIKEKINNQNKKIIEWESKFSLSKSLFFGVKTILENKHMLPGIIDIVKNIMEINTKYNVAFSNILNSNLQSVIVDTKSNAKIAIEFLKKNKTSKVTFIPLDVKIPKAVNEDEHFILKSISGFIGIASNLVSFNEKYNNVIKYLLSRHLICEDIDAAIKIAKMTNYYYTITCLDGTQIKPFGILVGGYNKIENLLTADTYKKNIQNEKEKIEILNSEFLILQNAIDQINISKTKIENIISQNKFILFNIDSNKKQIEEKMNHLNSNYKFLTMTTMNTSDAKYSQQNVLDSLKNLILEKDSLEQKISIAENEKNKYSSDIIETKKILKNKNIEIEDIKQNLNNFETDILKASMVLNSNLKRLVISYNITYEHAKTITTNDDIDENQIREEIKKLKIELKEIGNVNLDVVQEYEYENNRYNNFEKEYNDLTKSVNKLMSSIKKMDLIIVSKFDEFIKNINLSLIKTFETLFNGGKARLVYSNPNDILNTGIDVEVNPPGKKISNINLLSGGEKSLVAISVLFAILKTQPLPLIILDEVEAPLDYANLKNFGKYLHTFIKTSQFILITHRTITMEYCDVLYGVTMQEKGISKILKVELLEAKELINNNLIDSKESNKLNMEDTKL